MRTEVIAEISNNHNGSFDRCIRLIDAAKNAGASAVKFQCYTPVELVQLRGDGPAPSQWGEQGWTMRDLYTKAQTPHEWFPDMVEYCRQIEMPWFSSVFGAESLALLESLDCPRYKIASLDRKSSVLRKTVRDTGKPYIVSSPTPGADVSAVLLYCPAGYPQESANFWHFVDSNGDPHYEGFSYHGTDPLVPAVSVAFGAAIVEVHMQLDDEPSELEANISLTATQFAQMVDMIQRIEAVS